MADKIVYSEQELEAAKANLTEGLNILKNDIETSINSDFSVLEELGLFSNGITKIKAQTASLGEVHNSLINKLAKHAQDYRDQESQNQRFIEYAQDGKRIKDSPYAGGSTSGREDQNLEKENGKAIENSYLKEVIPLFSSESRLQMLKNLLTYNTASLTALFTDAAKSNMLIYQLKKMLKDNTAVQSELSLDEEKELQKQLLESIAKEEKNLFLEVDEVLFLAGLSYYKQVALKNNMNVSDLLIDEKHEELLMKSFHDMYYDGDNLIDVPKEEIKRVKEYFDNLSKAKNISVNDLLSDKKYMEIIKEGVMNDPKS